jgi:chromosome condensin MukBEF ATPase and DNA-binding subunit MukB
LEAEMSTAVKALERNEAATTKKTDGARLEKKKMANESKSEMVRIQFDFSREALSSLDQLVKDLNVKTRAEVIRRALEVYIDIFEAKGKKAKVFIEEQDGTRTRILGI